MTDQKPKRKYDEPRPGYLRATFLLKEQLLKDFKAVAVKEEKTILEAVNEALENWTYFDDDQEQS